MLTQPGRNTLSVAISPKPERFALAIDAAPPKTRLETAGARRAVIGGTTYFGSGLTLTLAAEDNPTGLSSGWWKTLYSLDGSAFTTYGAPLAAFSREGPYTLRYYALDNVGNAETLQETAFSVDTSAPETRLEPQGPHIGDILSPSTRIALKASDNLSGVAQILYRIDEGKEQVYAAPFALGALANGRHRLSYLAVDAVGNREDRHEWPFTLAGTVADVALQVSGNAVEHDGTVFVTPGSRVTLKPAASATGIEIKAVLYQLDDAAPVPYAAALALPAAGRHRLRFHAVDVLGNEGATHSVDLFVDGTPPASGGLRFEGPQIAGPAGTLIGGDTRIVLEAGVDAGVGGAALEYSVDGGRWQPYSAPFTLKTSAAVSYRARDRLGKLSAVQTRQVVVDSQGPLITVSYSVPAGAGDTVELPAQALIFVSAEDHPAGLQKITYRIDNGDERIFRTPLSGFAPGSMHTIVLAAEDLLGNRSEKTIRLHIAGGAQ